MGRAPFELRYENDRLLHADSLEEIQAKLELKTGGAEENGDGDGGEWPW